VEDTQEYLISREGRDLGLGKDRFVILKNKIYQLLFCAFFLDEGGQPNLHTSGEDGVKLVRIVSKMENSFSFISSQEFHRFETILPSHHLVFLNFHQIVKLEFHEKFLKDFDVIQVSGVKVGLKDESDYISVVEVLPLSEFLDTCKNGR
jgi:hypothetical protein